MNSKIVIIGAAILDILVSPASPEVFTIGSSPAEDISLSFGGDALNEATVLASLGKHVCLETIIGNDPEGTLIRNHCWEQGIELPEHAVRDGLKTGINVVLVQEDGERSFLTNRNGSLRKLRLQDISREFPTETKILCFASIFVFPEIGNVELAEIFRAAKEQNIIVCADMTKRKNGETAEDMREALSYIDYLIPNEEEACLLTGKSTAEEAAEVLREVGSKNVIIKCGKRGCYISSGEERRYIAPEEAVKPVDTTGAGDSFTAGFLYGLSEGWTLEECAGFANKCGAQAVQSIGAATWCKREREQQEENEI